jgi:hypothetical protein
MPTFYGSAGAGAAVFLSIGDPPWEQSYSLLSNCRIGTEMR